MRYILVVLLYLAVTLNQALGKGFTRGNISAGYWFVYDGSQDVSNVLVDDGYGDNYLARSYSLLSLAARLRSNQLFGQDRTATILHIDGKSLINPTGQSYTFGYSDRGRFELRELAIEMREALPHGDLWLGRQTVFEAGAARFDGPRAIFRLSPSTSLAAYFGLGQDPRNLTGYIGPDYSPYVFSLKYLSAGSYVDFRGKSLSFDLAINSEFFQQKIDRVYLFAQGRYLWTPQFSLAGQILGSVTPSALNQLQLSGIYKPGEKIINTLSYSRWQPIQYKASQASAIPYDLTSVSNPLWLQLTKFNNSSYQTIRNHIAIFLQDRNYIFASLGYTHRSFDDASQWRYSIGYRDPNLFNQPWDLRIQSDVIQNFRGFNAMLDLLLGHEIGGGPLRLEGGATLFANERDIFLDNMSTRTRRTEREFALRANAMYFTSQGSTISMNYSFYGDVDSSNSGAPVDIHELFVGTNLSF